MAAMEDTYHLGVKALIRSKNGEILLLKIDTKELTKNKYGAYWDLPGGRVHKGISPQETLQREIEEETGLQHVSIGESLGMGLANIRIPLPDGQEVGLILSVYECSIPPSADIILSSEHTSYEWCAPKTAAVYLATKFPPELCRLVAELQ